MKKINLCIRYIKTINYQAQIKTEPFFHVLQSISIPADSPYCNAKIGRTRVPPVFAFANTPVPLKEIKIAWPVPFLFCLERYRPGIFMWKKSGPYGKIQDMTKVRRGRYRRHRGRSTSCLSQSRANLAAERRQWPKS